MFWLNTESELYLVEERSYRTDWWSLPWQSSGSSSQWTNERGEGLIPGQGSKIPHASWPKNQDKKQKQYYNKLNEDSKNGPQQNKIFKLVEEILKTKQRDSKI